MKREWYINLYIPSPHAPQKKKIQKKKSFFYTEDAKIK